MFAENKFMIPGLINMKAIGGARFFVAGETHKPVNWLYMKLQNKVYWYQ